jgi:hypothetical protein
VVYLEKGLLMSLTVLLEEGGGRNESRADGVLGAHTLVARARV